MNNRLEEQRSELEALREIYYNEIKVDSETPPISFSISIESTDEASVELRFEFTPNYPDEKPSITVLSSEDLDEDELNDLLTILNSKAQEAEGSVMTLMLVNDALEWLLTKSQREDEAEEERKQATKQQEEEESRKLEGTPVTQQTFLEWKAKFEAEMLKARFDLEKQLGDQSGPKRLTGRQMFETDTTLAESDLNFVEDLDQSQIEALLQDIDEVDLDGDEHGGDDDDEDEDFDGDSTGSDSDPND